MRSSNFRGDLAGAVELYEHALRLEPEIAARVPGLPPPVSSDPETERYQLFSAIVDCIATVANDDPVLLEDDLLELDEALVARRVKVVVPGVPGEVPGLLRREWAGRHEQDEVALVLERLVQPDGEWHRDRVVRRLALDPLGGGHDRRRRHHDGDHDRHADDHHLRGVRVEGGCLPARRRFLGQPNASTGEPCRVGRFP